ncbi:MAG TPA: hypothetical protein PKW79_01055 [Rhabdochlamydiaceae bacterium]|nr:hypothetical protein [Rhabdochlamydiaceae bacterium]
MRIGVLGVNHKSAPLSLREKVSHACQSCSAPDKVILSTCHRTEIYFSHDDLAEVQCHLFREIKERLLHDQEHAFYSYFGRECFFHLACVTAGLDSAMLAESDVQRQVKIAYEKARILGALTSPLHFLFQKSLKLGKKVRSSFPLFQTSLNLEGMIYQLTLDLLGEHSNLLFIGNSDINRKIIHYFWRRGKKNMTLCTRHIEPAIPFALDYELSLKARSELHDWHSYEGIISATTSDSYLIRTAPENIKTRLILDLSVPRSVDPALQWDPALTVLNMEEIGKFFDKYHADHLAEVSDIKTFLQEAVHIYAGFYEKKSLYFRQSTFQS